LKFKWITGLIERIYETKRYQKIFIKKHTQKECFRQLFPGEASEELMKEYHCKKIRGILLGLFICLTFLVVSSIWNIVRQEHNLLEWQTRPGYFEGASKERWIVRREDGSEQEISLEIEERLYTREEAMEQLAAGKDTIDRSILGNNTDAGRVEYPLILPVEIEGTGILVQWMTDRPDVIDAQGMIREDFQDEEGAIVRIKGILRCQGYEDIYIRDFHVYPSVKEGDAFWDDVKRELKMLELTSREEEGFRLPEIVNGEEVIFFSQKSNRTGILCVLGIVAVYLQSMAEDEKLLQETKRRRKQLMTDYPELISKLIVLMRAGLTTQSAFELISADYLNQREKSGKRRYAYEELLITCREIQNGVSQEKAFERYGKRCGLIPYMRLGGLLAQNLKRGSRHLFDSLNEEAREAFEERKRRAKKAGEEAGTQMLMPMMILLVTTIVIVLYPAFISFQI